MKHSCSLLAPPISLTFDEHGWFQMANSGRAIMYFFKDRKIVCGLTTAVATVATKRQ